MHRQHPDFMQLAPCEQMHDPYPPRKTIVLPNNQDLKRPAHRHIDIFLVVRWGDFGHARDPMDQAIHILSQLSGVQSPSFLFPSLLT